MRSKRLLCVLGGIPASVLCGAGCEDSETSGAGGGTGENVSTATTSTGSAIPVVSRLPSNQATTSTLLTSGRSSSTASGAGSAGGADGCPGTPISVSPGDALTLSGTTASTSNDLDVFCAPQGTAGDVVFQLDVTAACSLTLAASGSSGWSPALAVRYQSCGEEVAGDLCVPDNKPIARHQEPGTIWLIVEGQGDTTGDFDLFVSCGLPVCGDAILNPTEACDYGPDLAGDTCSGACQVEDAAAADSCAQLQSAFSVPVGESHVPSSGLWFNNANATDDYKATCMPGGEVGGQDEVFRFVPEVTGALTISTAVTQANSPVCSTFLEPECWYSFLYLRGADCENGGELGCNGIDVTTGVNQLTVNVTAGETYHLFVDGLNDTFLGEGPYTLHFSLSQ